MKNKILATVLSLMVIMMSFVGCTKEKDVDASSNSFVEYEYTNRDLREPKYITPATDFAGGSGTKEDPYKISNAEQLALLGKNIEETSYDSKTNFDSAYYVLTADISLNNTTDFENWEEAAPEYDWKPIGFEASYRFSGVLDGAGYTISGMYINTNCEKIESGVYGLFSKLSGTVKNLKIDKAYIAVSGKTSKVGSIAGSAVSNSSIEKCSSKADIYTYDNTCGGIVGATSAGSTTDNEEKATNISDCQFSGTVTQVKDGSMSYIGGIVGDNSGNIKSCVNNGIISFRGDNVDVVGGIVGKTGENVISNCQNNGKLNCEQAAEKGIVRVGGIVGLAFLSATGSAKYMSRGLTITDCVNNAEVNGQFYTGGIVGHANNDRNDYTMNILNCTNNATASAQEYSGGIIGKVECTGDNDKGDSIVIKNCINKAELSNGIAGGIIGGLKTNKGDITIENCKNTANLSAKGQHCAGILAYWLMDSKAENINVNIKSCINTGNIQTPYSAGGIISIMDSAVVLEKAKNVAIKISDCNNSGNITTAQINGGIGGVIGVLGMKEIPTSIENCNNSGNLSITKELSKEEADGTATEVMTVARVAGGIIGRAGQGLRLTVDNDKSNNSNINGKKSYFVLKNCRNTGKLSLADDRESVNVKNYFGGIIGYASAEKEYSVSVENCSYSGFERGLGNKDLSDIGQKS